MRDAHPFLIHSRRPQPAPIAHRGFSACYPENTMAAFEAAAKLGFEYLETDVRATRDGHVAVFHDDTLERMTGARGRIEDLSLAELRKLRVAGTEPLPLLAGLLRGLPDMKVNIDPKTDGAAALLMRLLRKMDVWDRVCVASFSGRRLEYMRREAGDRLCTSAGPGEITRLWLSRFGLPAGRIRADCVQAPPRRSFIRVVDEAFVKTAHARGLPVHVWTINDSAEMETLLACGVDGIMTDDAEAAMRLFEQRVWQTDQVFCSASPAPREKGPDRI